MLYEKMLLSRRRRDVFVASPESIKSVFLKFVELLNQDPGDPRIPPLRSILRLWKTSCTLIMDEVDLLLHPLKSELNFPIGAKTSLDCSPERWEIVVLLLDAIGFWKTGNISVPLFAQSVDARRQICRLKEVIERGIASHALQTNPHLVLLDKAFYFEEIRPCLIQLVLDWLQCKHVFHNIDRDLVVSYLSRSSKGIPLGFSEDVLLSLPPLHLKYLDLIYDHITVFLPHCLSKIDRVSFGLLTEEEIANMPPKMPISRALLAIPFVGKDVASVSSEFAHPDVLISLSVLAYLYEGLRRSDVRNVIVMLKRSLLKEVGPRDERPSSVLFRQWIAYSRARRLHEGEGELRVNQLSLLQLSDEDQMTAVLKLLKFHPGVTYYYLNNKVFPEQMHHHSLKLSASGQELGGDVLFRRRLGFSGTSNSLIPLDLGECQYQPGADGTIIDTLCNADVVSVELKESTWTVETLLRTIAESAEFHALIDSGAIITGMSNEAVARFLLRSGLSHVKGVVYLNEDDKQMVLLRGGEATSIPLNECGLGWDERFTFYDQVHTTGIDIKQAPNSVAVQTIGKDSNLRDIAQGAWRMRGIGDGQKIRFFVVPEILNLVKRNLGTHYQDEGENESRMIRNLCAWLVLNGMRLENLQFAQLQQQNLANVWRRIAYGDLLGEPEGVSSPLEEKCRLVFRERVDFSIDAIVPVVHPFSEMIDRLVLEHEELLSRDLSRATAAIEQIRAMSSKTVVASSGFDSQQERESEVEVEQETEAEQEQLEVVCFSRDDESENGWNLGELSTKPLNQGHPFYPMSRLSLAVSGNSSVKLSFPENVLVSNNFFRETPSTCRFRKLKNVYMILHWIPSLQSLRRLPRKQCEMTSETIALAEKIFTMFDADQSETMDVTELGSLLREVGLEAYASPILASVDADQSSVIERIEFHHLVERGFSPITHVRRGRYFVVLSLAEFESLRFLLHSKHPLLMREDLSVGIQLVDGAFLACSPMFASSRARLALENEPVIAATQCFRFLNSDFHYSKFELSLLMSAVEKNDAAVRELFFDTLLRCRRRERNKRDNRAPVSRIFRLKDGIGWMLNRAIRFRLLLEIDRRGIKVTDCFQRYDLDSDGFLSVEEMVKNLSHLRLSDSEVAAFVNEMDVNRDNLVDTVEFWTYLAGDDEEEEDADAKEVEVDSGMGRISSGVFSCSRVYGQTSVPALPLVHEEEEGEVDGAPIPTKSDEDPELDEAVSRVIADMFSQVDPSEGFAFLGDGAGDFRSVYLQLEDFRKSQEWKLTLLLATDSLVRSATHHRHYAAFVIAALRAMQNENRYHDKARRLLMMVCSDHLPPAVSEELMRYRGSVIVWAFRDWGITREIFQDTIVSRGTQSMEDALVKFRLKKMDEELCRQLV